MRDDNKQLTRTAAWLRLFQNGGGAQAPRALAEVGLPASIASVHHSADRLLSAYEIIADRTNVIVLDGHGRWPEHPKAKAGLALRDEVTGPDEFQVNSDCELLILGACFQAAYLPSWRKAFPNAVIVAAVGEVPDGVKNGCGLIANLIHVGLQNGAMPMKLRSAIESFEDRFPKVKEAEFLVDEPAG